MKRTCLCITLALAGAVVTPPASAADRVKTIAGKQASGELTEMSAAKVVLELGSSKREFPVNEIESVQFDAEPNPLSQARIAVRGGRYDDALTMLARIDPGDLKRPEVATDVQFYKALASARLALSGGGSIADAGKMMVAFERGHRDSFHYLEACETLGDLSAAFGQFSAAESYYDKLAQTPWPDYKMRAGVLVGRALVSQKKFDQAAAKFEEVLQMDATGDEVEAQKAAASLGKASALGGLGKTDEAVQLVDEVIAKADPENEDLYARAYNVLGNCHKAAGKKKEARLAFLHVDLLYSRNGELHAESLANLASLWDDLGKPDRADQARSQLKEKYPNSVWAKP